MGSLPALHHQLHADDALRDEREPGGAGHCAGAARGAPRGHGQVPNHRHPRQSHRARSERCVPNVTDKCSGAKYWSCRSSKTLMFVCYSHNVVCLIGKIPVLNSVCCLPTVTRYNFHLTCAPFMEMLSFL